MKAMMVMAAVMILASGQPAAAAGTVINRMGESIELNDTPGGAILRTMGGDIRVVHAQDSVVAKTMGGDIVVDRVDGRLKASTMGGTSASTTSPWVRDTTSISTRWAVISR